MPKSSVQGWQHGTMTGIPISTEVKFGWFPSSGLETLVLQALAWPLIGKLELQGSHSQAGAWERAKGQGAASKTDSVFPSLWFTPNWELLSLGTSKYTLPAPI